MNRTYNNLIAILIVVVVLSVILAITAGCSSITMVSGAKGTDSYERISFRGPPKDFKALDFKFGDDTRLRAGEAATADQPWADVAGNTISSLLMNVNAYCTAYPVMCADRKNRDAPEYTPQIIRRAEVYCRAYPGMCDG